MNAFFIVFLSILVYISFYFVYLLFVLKNFGRGYEVKIDSNYEPNVSLIICAYNEEKVIAKKIENTLGIQYPRDRLEIIVFDNGSEDKTLDVAKNFARDGVKICRLHGRNRGKTAGLNEALRCACGDIIVISDADVLLKRDVLRTTMPYFADSSVGAIAGNQRLLNPYKDNAAKMEENMMEFFRFMSKAESAVDSTIFCSGELLAFRRELIDRLDEDMGDDVQIVIKVRKTGHRVLFLEDAYYYTYTPSNLRIRSKQKIRRSSQLIQMLIRHRDVIFNQRYGIYGVLIYPWNFFMYVISPYIFFTLLGMMIPLFIFDFWDTLKAVFAILVVGFVLIATTNVYLGLKKEEKRRFLSPFSFVTFIQSQLSLMLGSLSLIRRKPFKWRTMEETRSLQTSKSQE